MQLQPEHKTKIRTFFGIFLIVFGTIGLVFPILPGWWVILIGLQFLGLRIVIRRNKPWTQIISLKALKKPKSEKLQNGENLKNN